MNNYYTSIREVGRKGEEREKRRTVAIPMSPSVVPADPNSMAELYVPLPNTAPVGVPFLVQGCLTRALYRSAGGGGNVMYVGKTDICMDLQQT